MLIFVICFITCFIVTLIFGKFVIWMNKRHKAQQNILHYVDNHSDKQGTPTMGGVMFIIPTCIVALSFAGLDNKFCVVAVAALLAYGVLGFLDDFLKVRHKENLGLKAYQKMIGVGGIAIILSIFAYQNRFIGSSITIPYTDITFDLGWWFLPLCFIVYIAASNAINLTDGLDGLAGSTSTVAFAAFAVILSFMYFKTTNSGDVLYAKELHSLAIFTYAILGGVLAFLWYNSHPASIFMGDTGSLALGGALATIAVFIKNPLIILIIGIIFVLTSISVIIQVVYFKLSKGKRVFIMAPFHHHLQYKGYKESKIVAFYTIVGIIAAVVGILSIDFSF